DEDAGIDAMKTIALSIISAGACLAAIGNLCVLGTTATQALIAYTAPDANACTIQLSQSAGLTPLALDVDPGTFANSNFDLSRHGDRRSFPNGSARPTDGAVCDRRAVLRRSPFFTVARSLYAVLRPDYLSLYRRQCNLLLHNG